MNENFSEDQIFQDLLLANEYFSFSNPFYSSMYDNSFLVGDDVVTLVPLKQDGKVFQIVYVNRKNGLYDSFEEINVDVDRLSIKFYGRVGRCKRKLLISAIYDKDEEVWNVRSHMKGDVRPSTLDDALDELLLLGQEGVERRENFISIINFCQDYAEMNDEQKNNDEKNNKLKK